MNSRERILAVLSRESVDRLPVDIWCTDDVFDDLANHFQEEESLALFKKACIDKLVWVNPKYSQEKNEDSGKHENVVTTWGVHLKPVDAGKEVYLERDYSPFSSLDTLGQIEEYAGWPDPALFDYDGAAALAKEASESFITLGPWVSFFEVYCGMRGLEQAMLDTVTQPDFVQAALDKIERLQTAMMTRFFDVAGTWIDCVFISDDMGGQQNLLLSLDAWDFFFKARLERWCRLIHDYNIKVFYHSDGAIAPLIPRLIDAGIDILNPIQHLCRGMELRHLKDSFGEKIIFHGGIDNQRLLPYGTPDDVRRETRRCLDILGAGNEGYICCSCHNIQHGTPVANILAMIEAVTQSSCP